MLTTKYVRDNLEAIKESLKRRKSDYPLGELLGIDEKWRKLKTETQELQAKRNKESIEISELKKQGKKIDTKIKSIAKIKDGISKAEKELSEYEQRIEELLWNMPNILSKDVPIGEPPGANKVIRKWGRIKTKNKTNHEDALIKLGLLDIERASKTAGARFYYLRGDLVLLEQSVLRFALDELSKKGYTPILPPFMLRKKYYKGVAPFSVFEDALYQVSESSEASKNKDIERIEDSLFLISTAEHALAAMHADEVLAASDLPLKYAGISPCFRREAGAHGKDTKGIFRVHQFDKVEQFIYAKQEDDDKYFNELLTNSEDFLKKLEIPYQAVLLCSGDTGHQMSKTIDLEAYFPSQDAYRELASCSSATDWQSTRLNIRYDEKGERKYVYTINNTAISAQRTLVAIVENYLNDDGTITVPKVLVPYMGRSKIE